MNVQQRIKDEIIALIAFASVLAVMVPVALLRGADLVAALGLRDMALALLGALIALLTRSGVTIPSASTTVDTNATPAPSSVGIAEAVEQTTEVK